MAWRRPPTFSQYSSQLFSSCSQPAEEPRGSQTRLGHLCNGLRRGSGLACSGVVDQQENEKCCEAREDNCGFPRILSSLRHSLASVERKRREMMPETRPDALVGHQYSFGAGVRLRARLLFASAIVSHGALKMGYRTRHVIVALPMLVSCGAKFFHAFPNGAVV